jgi:hydrogenase expression/formation protein HypC
VELNGTTATISMAGTLREVDVSLIEEPRLGDYVLVHAGIAISRVEEAEAREIFEYLRQAAISQEIDLGAAQ